MGFQQLLDERLALMRMLAVLIAALLVLPAAAPTGEPVGPHQVGCNPGEIMTEHVHTQLDVSNHGRHLELPANIGIVGSGGLMLCIYWIHTHDTSGLIHVEAPMGSFDLADFFAVWGEPLSRTQVGSYHGRVAATVNGKPYAGDPGSIPLLDNEHVVLRVN
jgi:hypothetical protein